MESDGLKYFSEQQKQEWEDQQRVYDNEAWIASEIDSILIEIWDERLRIWSGIRSTPAMEKAIVAFEEALKLIQKRDPYAFPQTRSYPNMWRPK